MAIWLFSGNLVYVFSTVLVYYVNKNLATLIITSVLYPHKKHERGSKLKKFDFCGIRRISNDDDLLAKFATEKVCCKKTQN
jgi:hypothetical protein